MKIEKLESKIKVQNCMIFVFLGMVMNLTVIVFNGGQMPVYFGEGGEVDSKYHFAYTDAEKINYYFLSDLFESKIGNKYLRFSIGDIFILGGFLGLFKLGLFGIYNKIKNTIERRQGIKWH